jgi:hypothetical protein
LLERVNRQRRDRLPVGPVRLELPLVKLPGEESGDGAVVGAGAGGR